MATSRLRTSLRASKIRITPMPLSTARETNSITVVGIVIVAKHVLAAQQHLQRSLFDVLLENAQALPRVLVEEAQARSKVAPPQASSEK